MTGDSPDHSSADPKPDSHPPPVSRMTLSGGAPGEGGDGADFDAVLFSSKALAAPTRPGILARLDDFDILQQIGAGGMGIVLLARKGPLDALVAIKLLRPELTREPRAVHRFLTEARHMSRMAHRHILKVLEVNERTTGPYYTMPFIKRGSLATAMHPGQPTDPALVLSVCEQVADALAYAHHQGVIHRDLKPANVLLDDEGGAHLSDFGLARTVFNDSIVEVGHSHCEGTAAYMSPAVAAGQAEDTRCDIYSFGAVLYELLTGDPPYEGRSAQEVMRQIRQGPPIPILRRVPTAPTRLAAIAEWAMARELRDRYASMGDVAADLKRVAAGEAPIGPHGKPRRRTFGALPVRQRLPMAVTVALIGVIGLVAWFAIHARQSRDAIATRPPGGTPATQALPGTRPAPPTAAATQPASPLDVLPDEDGLVARLAGSSGKINQVGFLPDGRRVYSRSVEDYAMRLWDVVEKSQIKAFPSGNAFYETGKRTTGPWAISRDGKWVVAGRTLWQIDGLIKVRTFDHADAAIKGPDQVLPARYGCAISPDDRLVVFGGVPTVYDMDRGGRPIHTLTDFGIDSTPIFSPDGRYLMFTNASARGIHVYRVDTWELLLDSAKVQGLAPSGDNVRRNPSGMGFSQDGGRILVRMDDGTVRVIDITTGAEVVRVQGVSELRGANFSPDGLWILSHDASRLHLSDAVTGNTLGSFDDQGAVHPAPAQRRVTLARFSPDGGRVLSHLGASVCLWDVATRRLIREFTGHTAIVTHVAFSPDGRYAVTGSDDKTLCVWRLPPVGVAGR